MNMTLVIVENPFLLTKIPTEAEQAVEAQKYFKEKYSSIMYEESTDSFCYKGYKFDYFLSGCSSEGNGYLLVDPDDYRLWMFDYGNAELMWVEYLQTKQGRKELSKPVGIKRSWFEKLFR